MPGLNRMIGLSLAVHMIFIGTLLFSPSLPKKKWTFGPVYTVDLVSLPSRAESVGTKTETDVSKQLAVTKPKERSVVLSKKPESLPVAPIQQIKPIKKKDEGRELEKAIEGVRRRVEASGSTTTQAKPSGQAAATGEAGSGRMNAYYNVLWSRITAEWAFPTAMQLTKNLEVVVYVTVSRSGVVSSLDIEKSSGNRYFDESALRAIRKAGPFPPIPETILGSSLELGIRFNSDQLK